MSDGDRYDSERADPRLLHQEGIPWKEEGLPFLKALQAEAMANAEVSAQAIPATT